MQTQEKVLFKLEIDQTELENIDSELDEEDCSTAIQAIEFEMLPLIDLNDKRRIKIYNEISDIDERINFINARVAELNSEIDSLTNHADGLDYTISVASGILTGLIDSFFVGELGLFNIASDEAKEQFREAKGQSNEIVNKFIEKYAKMRGYKPKAGDGLKEAVKFLEGKFKVAQDNTWSGKGISSPSAHHLDDLAHHPTLMGLLSSILVQFFRISFFASKDGKWHPLIVETSMKDLSCWIPVLISGVLKWLGYMAEKTDLLEIDELPESMQWLVKNIHKLPIILQLVKVTDNWFGHIVSDMAGSKNTAGGGMGIPGIFISLLKEISMIPGLQNTDLPKIVNDLYTSRKYTTDRVDLRTEIAAIKKQALPIVINEVIVRTFYFIRHLVLEYQMQKSFSEMNWRTVIPFGNRTVVRMMTIATGTFTAVDVADAAIRSGGINPTCLLRINFVGVGRFVIAVGADIGMGINKSKKENERIKLMGEQIDLLNAKLFYKEADMWIEVEKTDKAMQELYIKLDEAAVELANAWAEIIEGSEKRRKYIDKIKEKDKDFADELANLIEWGI